MVAPKQLKRLWSISDVHVDYKENWEHLQQLSDTQYQQDLLILAGDATDDLDKLAQLFVCLASKFETVSFVPGNHELWLRSSEAINRIESKPLIGNQAKSAVNTSVDKFHAICALAEQHSVTTRPIRFGHDSQGVWVVPLFSWYDGPDQSEHSLYLEKKGVEDRTAEMWSDFHLTKWPATITQGKISPSEFFSSLNHSVCAQTFDAPVVSFSHFLPRQELMLSTKAERAAADLNYVDPHPEFNFSHVAGSVRIEKQLRSLGSKLHIYGHQHRNRFREIEGVTYVSHCMGYPKERARGFVKGRGESHEQAHAVGDATHPLLIWDTANGFNGLPE